MKKIVVLLSTISLLGGLISCREESFLNTEPTETISTPSTEAKLYGAYLMMAKSGTGGTSQHSDFGQRGYDIFTDLLSSDMAMPRNTYGHYREIVNLTATTDYTDTYNYMPWRYYYRLINAVNDVIKETGGNGVVPANQNDKYLMGQAKVLRAHAYFYLLQLYTAEYSPSSEAIPLYLEPNMQPRPKSTQAEVYSAIISDLNDAVTLLDGFNRPNKGVVNKYVAKGMLAYTYAAMGDNANASTLALEVMNSSGHSITTKEQVVRYRHNGATESGGGFNDLRTGSWMWGIDITTNSDLGWINWWGQADVYTYGYQWAGDTKSIDEGLYNSIRTDDIRKNQFVSMSASGAVLSNIADTNAKYSYIAANKFFTPERVLQGTRNTTNDYFYMRVDEFHLLAAETLAKQGNDAQARTILTNYLSNRITNVSYINGLSGASLQAEIYKNTRIEFWGEGKSYLAMKRNRATITRGSNHLYHAGTSFQYNDSRLSLKIPQQEVLNNPYIN